MQHAIRRNRDHAAELPGPVSMTYATLASVAEHDGDPRLWRQAARNNVLVLRRHLGDGHEATLGQELVFGDSMVALGAPDAAAGAYRTAQRNAVEAGNTTLAAGAAFRGTWLAMMQRHDRDALRLADEAVALAGADDRQMAERREILRTRIAVRDGDAGALDSLAARVRQSATGSPQLLFAPAYDDFNPALGRSSFEVERNALPGSRPLVADIGYWIRSDGRASDIKILHGTRLGQWLRPSCARSEAVATRRLM